MNQRNTRPVRGQAQHQPARQPTASHVAPLSPIAAGLPSIVGSEISSSSTCLLLTVPEAADVLRMSRSSLYKLLATQDLPSIKVGRMRRIPLQGLKEWLNNQTAA